MANFDVRALNKLGKLFRDKEQSAALTLASSRGADLSRQPSLQPKPFTVQAVHVAVSPDCSFRFLAEALATANSELLVYLYNISAPHLRDLLASAKARGVLVRVMIDSTDPHDASGDEFGALKALGVKVKVAPSKAPRRVFTVCHQKFVVIDRKKVVIESANWATSAVPEIKVPGQFKMGNREWFVRVDDPGLAKWFADLFNADWDIPETASARVDRLGEMLATIPTIMVPSALASKPVKVFDSQLISGRAEILPIVSPVNYLPEVLKVLQSAQRSIDIQQQYIKAGTGVNELLRAIHERKAAGVRVRIVSSAKFDSWDDTILTLKAAGLVENLKSIDLATFTHCHNKGVLVDGRFSVVSSTNWSENSIVKAREAGLLIDSRRVAKYFGGVFTQDWATGLTPAAVEAQSVRLTSAEFT